MSLSSMTFPSFSLGVSIQTMNLTHQPKLPALTQILANSTLVTVSGKSP